MSIVEVKNIQRNYQQGEHIVRALRGVDLTIKKGEFTALMGPSGSGKTTLLNIIGGLDKPNEGEVSIDGQNLSTLSSGELSDLRLHKLGFVFQAYNLIPVLTAYENTEFVLLLQGKNANQEKVLQTLASVGLEGMEHRRPSELSGGQQQRVAVARAIVGDPVLVLADEPTANLDSKTGNALIDLMKELNEKHGVTFVFSTHDPKVKEAAKRIVELEDGNIINDSTR